MITVKHDLIITEQVYKVVCDYAKRILLKEFILKFSFQKNIFFNTKIKRKEINPLLQSLNFNQGEMVYDDLEGVNDYIQNYISQLKQSDIHALYFLTFEENYLKFSQDFEDNDGCDVKFNYDKFDAQFGRELAYKIYEAQDSGLDSDLEDLLKNNIFNFSNEIDLSLINKYSVEYILEIVDNLYS